MRPVAVPLLLRIYGAIKGVWLLCGFIRTLHKGGHLNFPQKIFDKSNKFSEKREGIIMLQSGDLSSGKLA